MPLSQYSAFAVVSSPGMHEMAARVVQTIAQRHQVTLPHHKVAQESFANGEQISCIEETVRRQHVFFFHALQYPDPDKALMSMFLANDALKRASVAGITLVIPYIPYLRQDRKDRPRVPISARLVADLIQSNKSVSWIITADMHVEQEQGFFDIPVDNLTSVGLYAEYFRTKYSSDLSNCVVASPDFGGSVRVRRLAKKMGDLPVTIFDKRRPRPNEAEIANLVGEPVEGRRVILFDDMADTGGSTIKVVDFLAKNGALSVDVAVTHGLFSGNALASLANAGISMFCTDSIPRSPEFWNAHRSWLTCVSMSDVLSEAVFQASTVGGSVSKLYT